MLKLHSKVKMKQNGEIGFIVDINRDLYLIDFMDRDPDDKKNPWLDWREKDDFIILPDDGIGLKFGKDGCPVYGKRQ